MGFGARRSTEKRSC